MSSSSEFDKTFSELELKRKTVKQLQRILKDCRHPSRGNKSELVKRVLASNPTLTADASGPDAVPGDRLEQLKLELEILKVKQQLQDTSRTEELKSLVDHISINNLPRPEPPVFTGDPLRFPDWESAFETLIESRPIPQREKIFYLRKYVSGKALEAIDGYLMTCTDNSYQKARETLSSRYGNSFAITEAFRNKLLTFPQIASKHAELLRKFADLLNQCAVAKETMPGLSVLDDCLELQCYARHLPEWVLSRWSVRASEYKESRDEYPKFKEFAKFVSLEADRANDPVFSLNALRGPGKSAASHNVHSVNVQSIGGSENQDKFTSSVTPLGQITQKYNQPASSFGTNFRCVKCESNTHSLAECRRLLRLSYNDRRDFVRRLGICFGCFQTGHQVADCSNRLICNLCSGNHPTCFHKNSKPKSEPSFSSVSDSDSLEITNTSKPVSSVSNRSLTKSSDIVTSMIVPVVINCKGTERKVTVYALLDTQSDTSFVDETIAQQLCGGYSTSLTISTLTSQSKTIKVNKYNNVEIKGLNTHKTLIIPELFTRKNIPINRSHIPTKETALQWNHLRPIASKLSHLKDYPVSLLIGYNCSEALIPLSVISGKANEPFAVRTNLGWSIVGGKGISESAEMAHTHRVNRHKLLAFKAKNSKATVEKLKSGLKDGSSSKVEARQTMVNNYQNLQQEFDKVQDDLDNEKSKVASVVAAPESENLEKENLRKVLSQIKVTLQETSDKLQAALSENGLLQEELDKLSLRHNKLNQEIINKTVLRRRLVQLMLENSTILAEHSSVITQMTQHTEIITQTFKEQMKTSQTEHEHQVSNLTARIDRLEVEKASLELEVQSMRQQSDNDKVKWPEISEQHSKQAMPPAGEPEVKYNRKEFGEGLEHPSPSLRHVNSYPPICSTSRYHTHSGWLV